MDFLTRGILFLVQKQPQCPLGRILALGIVVNVLIFHLKFFIGTFVLESLSHISAFIYFCSVIASQGCPKGWKKYGSSCYLLVMRQMSWGDSRTNCLAFGADMVSILDSAENDFIYEQTKTASATSKFWIGLIRKKTTIDPKEGWIWSDGNNFTNSQWRQGEPNNYGKVRENCAELFKDGNRARWNDNDCAISFSSICKKNKGNLGKLNVHDTDLLNKIFK